MPTYGVLVGGIEPSDAAAYAAAYTEAVRTVMFSTGILTLLAAPVAWFLIGRRDPLADRLAAPGRTGPDPRRDQRRTVTGYGMTSLIM